MKTRNAGIVAFVGAIGVFFLAITSNAEPPTTDTRATATKGSRDEAISVAEARERARLMHQIYLSTLEAMHHHYFRGDRPVLPARAMEDIFDDIDDRMKIRSRWISVNTPPMSIQHEPKTEFEKTAARAIASGKAEYEHVEGGVYQRAGVVPLGIGCVNCHTKFFTKPPKTPRFAGLVISIPVKER